MGLISWLRAKVGAKGNFETARNQSVHIGNLNRRATYCRSQPSSQAHERKLTDDIEVTDEFRNIIDLACQSVPILFVTGKAGTGKTTLIHLLRDTLEQLGRSVAVIAPTGVAAIVVGGTTMHSFFHFPPSIVLDDDIKKVQDRELYSKLDLLIVDEVSMVRADYVDAMDRFLRLNGRKPDQLFGGTPIMFVGDLFQLRPVVTRKVEATLIGREYSGPYFFSAHCLQASEFTPVELTRVFRQRDQGFSDLLNRIRVGEQLGQVVAEINGRCFGRPSDRAPFITLTCTNSVADRINLEKLNSLPGALRVFKGTLTGRLDREREIRLASPLKLELKVGCQVMFTQNDQERRWVNGTVGVVRDMRSDDVQVELLGEGSGQTHQVPRATWQFYEYQYDREKKRVVRVPVGSYSQIPLMLAWAITIHKSQGNTLERIRIDLGRGAFAPGQVYVALSRCRSLNDIELARPIRIDDLRYDLSIRRFYEDLQSSQA